MMNTIPKIEKIDLLNDFSLIVFFNNNEAKRYTSEQLFKRPEFLILKSIPFFKTGKIVNGGHGIYWDDVLDISENELWMNGETIQKN